MDEFEAHVRRAVSLLAYMPETEVRMTLMRTGAASDVAWFATVAAQLVWQEGGWEIQDAE